MFITSNLSVSVCVSLGIYFVAYYRALHYLIITRHWYFFECYLVDTTLNSDLFSNHGPRNTVVNILSLATNLIIFWTGDVWNRLVGHIDLISVPNDIYQREQRNSREQKIRRYYSLPMGNLTPHTLNRVADSMINSAHGRLILKLTAHPRQWHLKSGDVPLSCVLFKRYVCVV